MAAGARFLTLPEPSRDMVAGYAPRVCLAAGLSAEGERLSR